MAEMTVRDNPDASRFEIFVDGAFAGVADYQRTRDRIIFPHVEVDPRFRGRSVASTLVRFALDTVRDEGTHRVVPVCPFVQTFIRRHREYQVLVDGPVTATGEE